MKVASAPNKRHTSLPAERQGRAQFVGRSYLSNFSGDSMSFVWKVQSRLKHRNQVCDWTHLDWSGRNRLLSHNVPTPSGARSHLLPPTMSASAILRARSTLQVGKKVGTARWVSSTAPKAYATHAESALDSAGDRVPAASKPLMKEFKIYRWVSIMSLEGLAPVGAAFYVPAFKWRAAKSVCFLTSLFSFQQNPDEPDKKPVLQSYTIDLNKTGPMVCCSPLFCDPTDGAFVNLSVCLTHTL